MDFSEMTEELRPGSAEKGVPAEGEAPFGICDLHTHSVHSDGTCTPEELICQARTLGLAAVALCDHNTVAGLPAFLAAAEGGPVEAVPGIEFSTEYRGIELHILGLFLRPEHYGRITALLEDFHRRKDQSNRDLAAALNRAGYQVDYGRVRDRTPDGHVNRAHIAAELTALGYTASIQEAFQKLLSPRQGFYRPPRRMDAYDTIRLIGSMGAVSVLAHPFLSMDEQTLLAFLPEARECGLHAMETAYSRYDRETTRKAAAIADRFGLRYSGGSDFHGANKPDIRLGSGRGDLAVPLCWLEELRKCRREP